MPRHLITDAQLHVWDRVAEPARQHRPEPVGPEQLIVWMDEAHVDRAVLVPPTWAADGNEVAVGGARRHPTRFRVMGMIDLESLPSAERIASWRSDGTMLGLRLSLHAGRAREMFTEMALDPLWAAAEAAGVPVMLYPPGLLQQVAGVARRYPRLRLVIDHMGAPLDRRPAALDEVSRELSVLAPLDNVAVKVSALPWYSAGPFPFSDVHSSVRRVVATFGPRRAFWGTDLTRLRCTYQEAVSMMAAALPDLTARDRELVMGRALAEWLDWPE